MDGTLAVSGQEETRAVWSAHRHQGRNTKHPTAAQDQSAGRGQQVLTRPGIEILAWRKLLMDTFQVGGNQIAGKVVTVTGTGVASTDGAGETELGARRVDQRQGQPIHDDVLLGTTR